MAITVTNGVTLLEIGYGLFHTAPDEAAGAVANFDVHDFAVTAEPLTVIDALDTGVRSGPEPAHFTLDTFGMPIPEA